MSNRPTISAVVISYRNPAYLDLCLMSLTKGKMYSDTQVLVILDGFAEESEHVISKYPGTYVIALEENMGQTYSHNVGATAASGEWLLILNDDNIAPDLWDQKLVPATELTDCVISPNQIEPSASIFQSFIIRNMGITPETFAYDAFVAMEDVISKDAEKMNRLWTPDGSTWPLLTQKKHFLMLGGIDPYFPHPPVSDWDFFYRAQMAQLDCVRYHGAHFYHFAGAATKKVDGGWNDKESESMQYFAYKWGFWPQRDINNKIILPS